LIRLSLPVAPPVLAAQSADIGECPIKFNGKGKLVLSQEGKLDVVTLNPFSYQTREDLIEGAFRVAGDTRRIKLPFWRRTTDDADFAEFVLLEDEYLTIERAVNSNRVQIIKSAGASKVEETIVVPAEGAAAVWMVTDAWHLSRVERVGMDVRARVVTLSAPFADLSSWFKGVDAKVREVKESEFGTIERALMYIGRKGVGVVTLGKVRDDGKVDKRAEKMSANIGVWAPELFVQPKGERVYAHDLMLQNVDVYEWWIVTRVMDIGFVSLKGAPILGVPPSSGVTKAILSRYITAAKNCFDAKTAVLSRLKMDRELDDGQKREVVNLLHRRGTFVINDASYRYRSFRKRAHVNIILKTPTSGYSQIMLERVDIKDCPTVLLRLVERSEDWPTTRDLAAEELHIKTQRQMPEEDFEQEMAYRRLITAAGKPSSSDTHREGARLVIALEQLVARDGDDKVLKEALSRHRPGVENEFREMAFHFKRMYAVNISVEVIIFLLVLMIEDQTPYAGWMTRKVEALMKWIGMSEKQFKTLEAGFVALKTTAFFAEGLKEAWTEGLGLEALVRGLSNSFTWMCVSPEGSLEFFGYSLIEQAPDLLALGPLFGATKFGLGMLAHAKHGFDNIAEIQQADAAASAGGSELQPADVAKIFKLAANTYMIPWSAPLTNYEAATGKKEKAYGEYTFESTPLGIPRRTVEDSLWSRLESVPLLVPKPDGIWFENLTSVSYRKETKTLTLIGKDDEKFRYSYYVEFKDQKEVESVWNNKSAERTGELKTELQIRIQDGNMIVSGPNDEKFVRPLLLIFNIDSPLGKTTRANVISKFVLDSCHFVSGTTADCPLGVTLRVYLVAVLARAMDLVSCSGVSKIEVILDCLLRDNDDLPNFKATLTNTASETLISDVSREFCTEEL